MDLLQMSVSGAFVILLVMFIRAIWLNRLPRRTFSVLWGAVLVRLLIPFKLPFRFSVWSFLNHSVPVTEGGSPAVISSSAASMDLAGQAVETAAASGDGPQLSLWTALWFTGLAACTVFFAASYIRCRRQFRISLPVDNEFTKKWLAAHRLRRRISIRQSECISSPLTYGIFRPVILMPETTDWSGGESLEYILAHEYSHIRHFDAAVKLLLTAALCIHWFNPLVWAMYSLANRDLELLCDSSVVRLFGADSRSAYALMLIHMEESKIGLMPMCNSFSKNSIEERITAIMKSKKATIPSVTFAVILTAGITAIFMTSASASSGHTAYFTDSADDSGQTTYFTESADDSGEQDISIEELCAEYALYGITARGDSLYYQEEKIRYFLDGYELEPSQGGNNTFARYAYYDETGTIDVHTVREDRQNSDGSTELFGPITAIVPYSQEEFDARRFAPAHTAQETTSEAEAYASENTGEGTPLEDRFLPYQEYGIEYRRSATDSRGNLYYLGRPVLQLIDIKNNGDAFTYQSPGGGELTVYTVYSQDGTLTGLDVQEIRSSGEDAPLNHMLQSQIKAQWTQTLAPYVPFGLEYQYDEEKGAGGYGLTMQYKGQEVRGILDPHTGTWITEHAGSSSYSKDAIELYAVYNNGKLTGLRPADGSEQKEWDELRKS